MKLIKDALDLVGQVHNGKAPQLAHIINPWAWLCNHDTKTAFIMSIARVYTPLSCHVWLFSTWDSCFVFSGVSLTNHVIIY